MASLDPESLPEPDEEQQKSSVHSRHLEPVEDEYHGRVIVDDSQTTFPKSLRDEADLSMSISSSGNHGNVAIYSGRVSKTEQDEMREAMNKIVMLESKMEIYDRTNLTTQRELINTKMQIGQLETNQQKSTDLEAQISQMKIKTDLVKLEQEKESLLVENEQLRQQMVQKALSQAEIERRMLMDFDKRLKEKLAELKIACNERDHAKRERDQSRTQEKALKSEKDNLQRDRDTWRRKSTEANKQIASLTSNLRIKDDILAQKEKVLMEFEEQCKIISIENTRLQRENGFLRSTIFHCVQVGTTDISAEISASKLEFVCYSCQTTYKPSMQTHLDKNCQFHPLPPMQFREWKLWPVGEAVKDTDMTKLYWPCCDILSYSRPDGCSYGRHHQSWERDIIMKTALSARLDQDNENCGIEIHH